MDEDDEKPEGYHVGSVSGSTVAVGSNAVGDVAPWLAAGTAMAVTPFLQAVATHFGSRLAGTIEDSTRQAFRRFLRRRAAGPGRAEEEAKGPLLLTNEFGWSIELDIDTAPEALKHLQMMQILTPPPVAETPTPLLVWRDESWRLHGACEGKIIELTWTGLPEAWTPRSPAG